ncbi:hypothetical protein [Streptomyces sp. NPDC049916]|uniref:hypothetical protein n=1 Tax=Streptomyces sp. NPDC049916 TaxID=3155156 RepID=UPI0034313B76
MKTAYTGDCLEKWPVVVLVAKNNVKGGTVKGFATFERTDGIKRGPSTAGPSRPRR